MFSEDQTLHEFRGPFGVPVQIAASIIILPFFLIDFTGDMRSLSFDLMFVAILIGSIFLHEVGHAWACLIQNVPVCRIVLHGGGGFCERLRSATRSEQELIVAMGPIVNLFLWAAAGLVAPLIADPETRWVFETISRVNLFLALFNMLPVQPLDGGKLFHLWLTRVVRPEVATRILGALGLVIILVWAPMLVMSYWYLGVILFFLPSLQTHWDMLRRPA